MGTYVVKVVDESFVYPTFSLGSELGYREKEDEFDGLDWLIMYKENVQSANEHSSFLYTVQDCVELNFASGNVLLLITA